MDARRRKQYVYHPEWQAMQLQNNFNHLQQVGSKIGVLRQKIAQYINAEDSEISLSRDYVLSVMIKIIDITFMRIGSAEYASDNETYGITTIRKKHVSIIGTRVVFNYVGKSGISQTKELENELIARIITLMLELPGYEVFKFYDPKGNICDVDAHTLNEFLNNLTDGAMTAKNFRTWHGSVMAIEKYDELYNGSDKARLEDICEYVSVKLGNTQAVVRDYYVHPSVIKLIKNNQKLPYARASKWLSKYESVIKKLIR